MPPLALKGKAAPLPAWLVVDARGPGLEAESTVEARLVGREAELAGLARAFDAALAERACRLATLVGSPGIGKTRLALGFAAARPGATVLVGRCDPESEANTFLPLAEILRGLARLRETDDGNAVRAALGDLLPPGDPDRDRVATRAAAILGVGSVGVPEETFWAVRRVLEEAARQRPLLIVVDDVHWAAPTFLDLIEHLAQWVYNAPILIVLLGRPELRELRSALVSARRAAVVIDLVPLDGSASRALLDGLLGSGTLPDPIASRLLDTGDGNPLFLSETLRMLIDDGVLERRDGAWRTNDEAVDFDVPPTITALLAARINRLAGPERAVVERASVIGKEFYRGAVAELVPPDVSVEVDSHLERLRRKEFGRTRGNLLGRPAGVPVPPRADPRRRLPVAAQGSPGGAARAVRRLARA